MTYAPSRTDSRIRVQPMDARTIKRGLGWFPMAALIVTALFFAAQGVRWAL